MYAMTSVFAVWGSPVRLGYLLPKCYRLPSVVAVASPPTAAVVVSAVRALAKECAAFSSHPELLSLLPYVESLEDNEAMAASGLATYSIIHDLKDKAVFDPTVAAAAADPTAPTLSTPQQVC